MFMINWSEPGGSSSGQSILQSHCPTTQASGTNRHRWWFVFNFSSVLHVFSLKLTWWRVPSLRWWGRCGFWHGRGFLRWRLHYLRQTSGSENTTEYDDIETAAHTTRYFFVVKFRSQCSQSKSTKPFHSISPVSSSVPDFIPFLQIQPSPDSASSVHIYGEEDDPTETDSFYDDDEIIDYAEIVNEEAELECWDAVKKRHG